jgi:hypothetical protein
MTQNDATNCNSTPLALTITSSKTVNVIILDVMTTAHAICN